NQELIGDAAKAVTVAWTHREKVQPPNAKFKVPPIDAPNVAGARLFGLTPGNIEKPADLSALRQAVEAGARAAPYRFHPRAGRTARSATRNGSPTRARRARCRC